MKILNAGCGHQVYGTHFIDKYPKREEVLKCDLDEETIPFPDEFFDKIYSKSLIEHLRNLGAAMGEFRRVLKPGGELSIVTDNAPYWLFHLGSKKEHYGDYEANPIGGSEDMHFALFTPTHIENYAKQAGLIIKDWEYFDDYHTIHQGLKFINWILRKTPLERFAYPKLIIKVGKKL